MVAQILKITAIALIMLLSSAAIPRAGYSQSTEPNDTSVSDPDQEPLHAHEGGDYVIVGTDEGTTCREATAEESQAFAGQDRVELHVIAPNDGLTPDDGLTPEETGLKIILRGTQQLENFPQAKNAFIKAAQTWEGLIQSPITMILDVDFGPTRFGVPFPDPNILGSTGTQAIGSNTLYPAVRTKLIEGASTPSESQLYFALPPGTVQTDIGGTAAMLAPSAVFRALGIIAKVADPQSETSALGPPPSIGFNSGFQFDFDPSDGIAAGKTDFDAVAVHEIGHALGFSSNVGLKEIIPSAIVAPTVLDLLRFRPGISLGTFTSAQRILSSGGTQIFFAGGQLLSLSTGRPDHTGGDGRQASHWKDEELTGVYLGIMDPTLSPGVRKEITDNDLRALDAMGYQVNVSGGDTIALTSGVPQPGSVSIPSPGSALLGSTQYTVQVPAGATQLKVDLDGNQDVDLYVRTGQRITVGSSGPVRDYASESQTGVESITITPASSPPLRAATYFIAVGNFGPGAASFNVRATVTGGGGGGGNSSPVIGSLAAKLSGDVLTLTGVVADPDGDIQQAQATLLNGAGSVVGQTNPFNVNFGTSTTVNFTLTVSNLSALPTAEVVSLSFIDRRANRSAPKTADFSDPDPGGPTVSNASYNGKKLVIKGSGFSAQVLIKINGTVIGITPSSSSKKIQIKGTPTRLNLHLGPNRLEVFNGSSRSNLFVLNL